MKNMSFIIKLEFYATFEQKEAKLNYSHVKNILERNNKAFRRCTS